MSRHRRSSRPLQRGVQPSRRRRGDGRDDRRLRVREHVTTERCSATKDRRRCARRGRSSSPRHPTRDFDGEDVIVAGDRCVVQWVYTWTNDDGTTSSLRGVDVLRVPRRQGRREVRVREGLTSVDATEVAPVALAVAHVLAPRCAGCRRRRPSRDGSSPARRAPSRRAGTTIPFGTTAPAPTNAPASITARCSTIEPVPISAPSCTVQHSRCARWPITTSSPTTVGVIGVVWRTAPSCTDVRAPTRITP